ncbi:hypothetical protein QTA58_03330 [Neorhizobium sp. CSC1952]|uniref:hypothetical protein n=1 Tax=Neorhizobium sp. CSC1952 TaxID=2978974 RepID=UPI0025A6675A|nr:hypothetical protein [Rhizobium sp. CSC1952]WJR67811.1 hypothetical protein QTA58_03330 [Rhizobium sp. CSC1952]
MSYFVTHIRVVAAPALRETAARSGSRPGGCIRAFRNTHFKQMSRQVSKARLKGSDVITIADSPSPLQEHCESGIVPEHGKLTYYDNLEDALTVHERNMTRQ